MSTISRRAFVQRAGLAGVSVVAAGLSANRAAADPDPPANAPAAMPSSALAPEPDVYAFQIGGTEAYTIHDGFLSMPGIQPTFAPEATKPQLEELLKKSFLPADHVTLSLNVLVLKGKSGVMLFDSGAGVAYGPTTGKLLRGLKRVGVSPEDVKTVFVTHAHPDHICGLVDDANKPVFGAARIIAARAEVDFWTSDSPDLSGMRTQPQATAQALATIKKCLGGVKSSLEPTAPGRMSSEVEMIPAVGHTPGHALFRVTQGEDSILVIGDAVHLYALQFPHPEWTMAFDTNPAQAIKTRLKLFKDAAAERTLVFGYHMPFPGIGHIQAAGHGYEWVPKPWVM